MASRYPMIEDTPLLVLAAALSLYFAFKSFSSGSASTTKTSNRANNSPANSPANATLATNATTGY